MGIPVQDMAGLGSMEIAAQPRGREITIRIAQESATVGLKQGYRIPKFNGREAEQWAQAGRPAVYAELDAGLRPKEGSGRNWRASMAQDVIKGRRSEIDFMNGRVVDKGRELGVPTPVSAAVVTLMREVDAGTRKPAPEHIELALDRATAREHEPEGALTRALALASRDLDADRGREDLGLHRTDQAGGGGRDVLHDVAAVAVGGLADGAGGRRPVAGRAQVVLEEHPRSAHDGGAGLDPRRPARRDAERRDQREGQSEPGHRRPPVMVSGVRVWPRAITSFTLHRVRTTTASRRRPCAASCSREIASSRFGSSPTLPLARARWCSRSRPPACAGAT